MQVAGGCYAKPRPLHLLTPVLVPHWLSQEWEIRRLSYEYDSEPFGTERDAAIKKLASEAGVEVTARISHTLYDLDRYASHPQLPPPPPSPRAVSPLFVSLLFVSPLFVFLLHISPNRSV